MSQRCEDFVVRRLALGLIGDQHFHDHLAGRGPSGRSGRLTTMPALGSRMQEAARTRSPSISTMQARQLPSER